jgi:hypothetical protein
VVLIRTPRRQVLSLCRCFLPANLSWRPATAARTLQRVFVMLPMAWAPFACEASGHSAPAPNFNDQATLIGIDGKSRARAPGAGHRRIAGMRECAKRVCARVDFLSRAKGGTEVNLSISAVAAYGGSGVWRWPH